MRNRGACCLLLACLLGKVLSGPSRAGEAPTPGVVVVEGITKDWQKLEGLDNQGTAAVEIQGNQARVAGAAATPFSLGDVQAGASAQVRLRMPPRGIAPDFGSAMLGLYGKNRSQRLMAFIAFKVPGMAADDCEIGFIAHKSIRRPAAFGKWYTLKLETKGGVARMKAWPDGSPEPDWMAEEDLSAILDDIEAVGLRTYALPVLFDGFSASGKPTPKLPKIALGAEAQGVTGILRPDGSLEELRLRYADGWQKVEFRRDGWRGPGFGKSVALTPEAGRPLAFVGEKDGIRYRLAYAVAERGLRLATTVENTGKVDFSPQRLPLTLGVDSFMDTYPRWNDLYFPTFVRCEPTHLWGYMMSPQGRILGVASPDPVGSYTIEYLQGMYAHHVYTLSLDLLQKPPVPAHHPGYAPIPPGGKRTWTVELSAIDSLEQIKPRLSVGTRAPMLELYRYTLEPGQPAEIAVVSSSPVTATITTPAGVSRKYAAARRGDERHQVLFPETTEYGDYTIQADNETGKTATGRFFVRPPWSWYLKQGRLEALRLTPRADLQGGADGYSCETHYGLLGFYLAAKHFPEPALDLKGDRILNKVLSRLYRENDGMRFSGNPERIQNGSFMLSVLVKRYEATGDLDSLEKASQFAEYLLSRQHKDGYYGGYGMHPYTSVLYVAKATMELMAVEKPLANDSSLWRQRYDRHYASVRRAIDHLVVQGRDVKTEGSGTFEDGAVSCTATQIALFALLQDDPEARRRYASAARQSVADHACLTRLLDTDARSIGGTLRWWEAWCDERREAQMMTSPHGWSGWRLYGVYYLYLLTGEEAYLQGLMNALGAGMQLLQWPSGRLNQAFVVDPHVHNYERVPDPSDPRGSRREERITGEDYIKTIGDWFGRRMPGDTYLDRVEWEWTGDGIPYEIFKAMDEIAVAQAFVIERADGAIIGYNCGVNLKGATIEVIPAEAVVQRVHVNLKTPREVRVLFIGKTMMAKCRAGMQWLTAKNASAPTPQ